MTSFPFRSTGDESEKLYQEYVGERYFERESADGITLEKKQSFSSQPQLLDEWSEYEIW